MCRRKLGYINEGDDNVDKKKKKNNKRNNNDTNDEIKAIEVEKKKLTNALADLYSRCKNSTDTYHLQFNPSLYGCFVDKYIEDKLKVGSTLRRIVEILLDNPRRSWKCINTNSLIFNNDEVKWLNSSLNTKKINQEVKSVFADLNIYVEVVQIKQVRILFIYNDNIGFKWSKTSAHGVKATTTASWLRQDPFGKKVRKRFEFARVDDNDDFSNLIGGQNVDTFKNGLALYNKNITSKNYNEEKKAGARYLTDDGNVIVVDIDDQVREILATPELVNTYNILHELTGGSKVTTVLIFDILANKNIKNTREMTPPSILQLTLYNYWSNLTDDGMKTLVKFGIHKDLRVAQGIETAIVAKHKTGLKNALESSILEYFMLMSSGDNYNKQEMDSTPGLDTRVKNKFDSTSMATIKTGKFANFELLKNVLKKPLNPMFDKNRVTSIVKAPANTFEYLKPFKDRNTDVRLFSDFVFTSVPKPFRRIEYFEETVLNWANILPGILTENSIDRNDFIHMIQGDMEMTNLLHRFMHMGKNKEELFNVVMLIGSFHSQANPMKGFWSNKNLLKSINGPVLKFSGEKRFDEFEIGHIMEWMSSGTTTIVNNGDESGPSDFDRTMDSYFDKMHEEEPKLGDDNNEHGEHGEDEDDKDDNKEDAEEDTAELTIDSTRSESSSIIKSLCHTVRQDNRANGGMTKNELDRFLQQHLPEDKLKKIKTGKKNKMKMISMRAALKAYLDENKINIAEVLDGVNPSLLKPSAKMSKEDYNKFRIGYTRMKFKTELFYHILFNADENAYESIINFAKNKYKIGAEKELLNDERIHNDFKVFVQWCQDIKTLVFPFQELEKGNVIPFFNALRGKLLDMVIYMEMPKVAREIMLFLNRLDFWNKEAKDLLKAISSNCIRLFGDFYLETYNGSLANSFKRGMNTVDDKNLIRKAATLPKISQFKKSVKNKVRKSEKENRKGYVEQRLHKITRASRDGDRKKIADFFVAMGKAALDGKLDCPEIVNISELVRNDHVRKQNPSIKGGLRCGMSIAISNLEAYEQFLSNRENRVVEKQAERELTDKENDCISGNKSGKELKKKTIKELQAKVHFLRNEFKLMYPGCDLYKRPSYVINNKDKLIKFIWARLCITKCIENDKLGVELVKKFLTSLDEKWKKEKDQNKNMNRDMDAKRMWRLYQEATYIGNEGFNPFESMLCDNNEKDDSICNQVDVNAKDNNTASGECLRLSASGIARMFNGVHPGVRNLKPKKKKIPNAWAAENIFPYGNVQEHMALKYINDHVDVEETRGQDGFARIREHLEKVVEKLYTAKECKAKNVKEREEEVATILKDEWINTNTRLYASRLGDQGKLALEEIKILLDYISLIKKKIASLKTKDEIKRYIENLLSREYALSNGITYNIKRFHHTIGNVNLVCQPDGIVEYNEKKYVVEIKSAWGSMYTSKETRSSKDRPINCNQNIKKWLYYLVQIAIEIIPEEIDGGVIFACFHGNRVKQTKLEQRKAMLKVIVIERCNLLDLIQKVKHLIQCLNTTSIEKTDHSIDPYDVWVKLKGDAKTAAETAYNDVVEELKGPVMDLIRPNKDDDAWVEWDLKMKSGFSSNDSSHVTYLNRQMMMHPNHCGNIHRNEEGTPDNIDFGGGTVFQIINNAGQGDCFLFSILEYLRRQGINPLLRNRTGTVNVNQYRQFLITQLLNPILLNADGSPRCTNQGKEIAMSGGKSLKNPDGHNGLSYYGNITKVNDVLWKKLRTNLRTDLTATLTTRKINACKSHAYLGELLFQLVVILYKDIKNIYVYKDEWKTWWQYFVDKEPNKNYAIIRSKKIKDNFKATKESTMFILFTSATNNPNLNHYELMIPLVNEFVVTVKPESSSANRNPDVDLSNEDDESSTMNNDNLLTTIVNAAGETTEQGFMNLDREFTDHRAKYSGAQDDPLVAFFNLAENEPGSDILKSFYARQCKSIVCTDQNTNIRSDKTPHDEIFQISFPVESTIQSLQELVKPQTTFLTGDNQWKYDGARKCNAEVITQYQFYDYVLIHLKIFNEDRTKRKFTADQQRTLIGDGTLRLPTVDDGMKDFQLIGTINHRDTKRSAHYVAVVKKQDYWWVCDDRETDPIGNSFPYFRDHEPYILFYKRSSIALDKRDPIGIANLGNSCYINALMQNMINVPELFIRNECDF